MISVLVNWAYIFVTTYIIGYFILTRAYKFFMYDGKVGIVSAVMAGLAATTVYAGFFSVIFKVGVLANVIMILACVVMATSDKEHYALLLGWLKSKKYIDWFYSDSDESFVENDENLRRKVRVTFVIKLIGFAIVFIAALFFTTEGNFFSDSGYYHEQSIRWIEEFGTVKGSVHILKRLAYNSCYFCQCALYSMREIWGQSLHCLSGFYAIVVMAYSVFGFSDKIKTNVLRLAPFAYFILLCSEITSPASDYPLVFSVFFVVIRWFELLDEKEEHYSPYALLSIFVVFIISIKLTVGCLVLIVMKPAIDMVKEKKFKEIIASIVTGVVIILPYFIRNYIICGWLIYPFTKIDIFNPDWKLPMRHVQSDADEIKIWGRGMGQIGGQVTDSIKVWLPHWWDYMSVPNRMVVASFGAIAVLYAIYRIAKFIVSLFLKDNSVIEHNALVNRYVFEAAILLSLVYWFLESPLFRYGVVYILITMLYMVGDMLEGVWNKGIVLRCVTIALCLATLLPLGKGLKEYMLWNYECIRYYSDYTYWVKQEDYPRVEYGTTDIGGITFYYPAEELGQIGYHMFPALWFSGTENIENRGDSITDGYRYK